MKNEQNGRFVPPVDADSNKFHNDHSYFEHPHCFDGIVLHQIGERYCRSGSGVSVHRHRDFYELTFGLSGRAVCRMGDAECEVGANELCLSLPHEEHAILSDRAEPFRYYYLAFSLSTDSPYLAYFEESGIGGLAGEERVRHSPAFFAHFSELLAYLDDTSDYAREFMGLLLRLTVLRLLPLFSEGTRRAYAPPSVDERRDLAYTVLRYIDMHLTELREMREIAEALGYSYPHLCRVFREKMGFTISHYCAGRKLELAREQLLAGEGSITALAARLNYSSVYAFSRAYRARFGESPRDTRTRTAREG